jgi:hypothetical protein
MNVETFKKPLTCCVLLELNCSKNLAIFLFFLKAGELGQNLHKIPLNIYIYPIMSKKK